MSIAQAYWDLNATRLVPVGDLARAGGRGVTRLKEVREFTPNQVAYFHNMEPRLIMLLGTLAGGIDLQDIQTKGVRWLKLLYDNFVDFRGLPPDTEYPALQQLWYTFSRPTGEYRMTTTHLDQPQGPYLYFFALTKWMRNAVDMSDVSYIVMLTNRIAAHNRSILDSYMTAEIRGYQHPDAIHKNLLRRELGNQWRGKRY